MEGLVTTLVLNDHPDGLVTRRSIFIGAAASLICAPAIVRVTSLMPVRRVPPPFGPQYAGFVERLYYDAVDRGLRWALQEGRLNIEICGRTIPLADAHRTVSRARNYGWLPPYISIYLKD